MKFAVKSVLGIGLIFVVLMLNACGHLNRTRLAPEEALKERVTAYWDARVEGNSQKAYELLVPEARRALTLSTYANRTKHSEIVTYSVQDIAIDSENNEATVRVERSFRIKPGAIPVKIDQTLDQTTDDRWVLVDGEWYMYYAVFPTFDFTGPPSSRKEKPVK